MAASKLTAFKTPVQFRAWLAKNHKTSSELPLQIFKVHAADRGVTYAQALDEALCYGWIDGVRRSVDADSFSIRFTPRKPRSIWSRINVGHAERLIKAGRMTKAGLAAFEARDEKRTAVYAFENQPKELSPELAKIFKANKTAWTFFEKQAPYYRRIVSFWVMGGKQEATRARRLEALIECCARGSTSPQMTREK
jgi:uncharacterized protein YdeI (YjbR/CyaY-like superfamily)